MGAISPAPEGPGQTQLLLRVVLDLVEVAVDAAARDLERTRSLPLVATAQAVDAGDVPADDALEREVVVLIGGHPGGGCVRG